MPTHYVNPYPIHEAFLAELKDNPALGKRKIEIYLKLPSTTLKAKLNLIALLLTQGGEKAAAPLLSALPLDRELLKQELIDLHLETAQHLASLIHYLTKSKALSVKDHDLLYDDIANACFERGDKEAVIYFSKLRLSLSTLRVESRHIMHLNLAAQYHDLEDEKQSDHHYLEALRLEESGKLDQSYIRRDGVVAVLITIFEKSKAEDLNKAVPSSLLRANSLAPSHKEIVKTINAFINEVLKADPSKIEGGLMKETFNLLQYFPQLQRQKQALLHFLSLIPDTRIADGDRAFLLVLCECYSEAEALAKKVQNGQALSGQWLFVLTKSLFCQEKFKEALEPLKALLAEQPKTREALIDDYGLAQDIYAALYDPHQAIYYAEETLKLLPNCVHSKVNLIVQHYNMGKTKAAKTLLQAAMSHHPDSDLLKGCQRQIFPQRVSATGAEINCPMALQGEIRYHLERREMALARSKLALFQEKYRSSNRYTIAAHHFMMKIHMIEQKYEEAIASYHLMKREADSIALMLDLSTIYLHLERYPEAIQQAGLILQHTHQMKSHEDLRRHAYWILYKAYIKMDCLDLGCSSFIEMLGVSTLSCGERQLLHYYLALFNFYQNNTQQAEEQLLMAINLNPSTAEPGWHGLVGEICFFNGHYQAAIESYKRFLKVYPQHLTALLIMGYAYHYCDPELYQEQALTCFSSVLALDPSCLSQLKDSLPASLFERLQNQELETSSDSDSEQEQEEKDQEEKDQEPLVIGEKLAEEPTTRRVQSHTLSAEQITHRFLQAEKKRLLAQTEQTSHEEEEKAMQGWQLENKSFLSLQDHRVTQLSLSKATRYRSRLYAWLDQEALQKAGCESSLYNKWQELLGQNRIAAKKGEQGLRFLRTVETSKLCTTLGQGYVAKLKLLGAFGDVRAYARLLPSKDEQVKLLCFDKVIFKAHR